MPTAKPASVGSSAAAGRRLQRQFRPLDRALGFGLVERLGQTPVHHQRLAVLAQHDVARLEIAVQHAAAVRIRHRVADVDEPAQQIAQFQRAPARLATGLPLRLVEPPDRVLETIAA